jgi:hypothetical protein
MIHDGNSLTTVMSGRTSGGMFFRTTNRYGIGLIRLGFASPRGSNSDSLVMLAAIRRAGKAVPIAAGFRPRGNSVQLSVAFFGDLHRVWEVEGIEALARMAKSDPISALAVRAVCPYGRRCEA